MSNKNNKEKKENIDNPKKKKEKKPSLLKKYNSLSKINETNKNIDNSKDEIVNISSEEGEKSNKVGLFEKLNFILREDDFQDYVWLIEEESKEEKLENKKRKKRQTKAAKKNQENMTSDEIFMDNRINKTLISSSIFFLFLVCFFVFNMFVTHWNINPVLYIILFVVFTFLSFKKNYFKLKKQFNKKRNEVYNSFPLWVSTLQILIISNNVTNTFKKSIPTCPKAFRKDLENFVRDIEYDPDNKEHYKNFLKKYKIDEINEIVMDMYIFNRMDKNEIVKQFSVVNERLNKIQNNIRQKKQDQSLFFISALNSIPLLTASLYVLLISMMLASV